MNILTDRCPDEIIVDGRSYKIITDWKDWVKFYCMLDDPDLRDRDREYIAMQYFTESEPIDSDEAMKALIKFASGEDMPQAGKSNKQAVTKKAACFSWLYDGAFVLSAFRQYYGIDLRTEKMHWYVFLSLFQGIPDDSPLKSVCSYAQQTFLPLKTVNIGKTLSKLKMPLPCRKKSWVKKIFVKIFLVHSFQMEVIKASGT